MATGRVPTTANSPLTAKGDLFGYSTTQARVAVGNNGETLVADSSTSTGLRYTENYAAGKNKILNSDSSIWQRGTSFTGGDQYTADRWRMEGDTTGYAVSRQSFTAGTAPVVGYESQFFTRLTRGTGGSFVNLQQRIEDVRTFANQTVTLSFWAKASASCTIEPYYIQIFGSGGSGAVSASFGTTTTLTTSWVRYSYTVTVASVSGKTIGAGSYLNILTARITSGTNVDVDTWGVQLEAGSVATAFQTATGTIQGELSACQRYYWRNTPGTNYGTYGVGVAGSATNAYIPIALPVSMRVVPTSIDVPSSVTNLQLTNWGTTSWTPSAIAIADSTFNSVLLNVTTTSLVTGQAVVIRNNNGATSSYFLGASAEL